MREKKDKKDMLEDQTLEISPSSKPRHVVNAKGETLKVPDSWVIPRVKVQPRSPQATR